jgi:transposase
MARLNIDIDQLTQLRKTHKIREIAEIFGCSESTIQRRLRKIPRKEEPKKRFTPKAREMLLESYL